MQFAFVNDLEKYLIEKYSIADALDIAVEICPENMNGDYTVNCFRFARFCKNAPDKVAAETGDFLTSHPDVEAVEVIKAFVNVTLKPAALFRDTVGDMEKLMADGLLPEKER